jgi:hypothetical protein
MINQCPTERPDRSEYESFYDSYIKLIGDGDIVEALSRQLDEVVPEWSRIDDQTSLMRHPPYTWSLREVIGHLGDAERVFGYRAFRFSRRDPTELAGFEENDYVKNAEFDRRPWTDLIDEFAALRRANILMLRQLPRSQWKNAGLANGHRITVHALAYVLVGHVRHHHAIIRRRLHSSAAAAT